MYTLVSILYSLLPLVGLILLFIGIKRNLLTYVISSLWISLIALIIHFKTSGGEILGSYFNYPNALSHSANMVILCVSLIYIFSNITKQNKSLKYLISFIQSCVVIGSGLLIINIWINAYFIENRLPGSPVMQVSMMEKPKYCSYKYIFYKVAADGTVYFLCPNYYGLIPSIGHLSISPDFLTTQMSNPTKKQLLQLQKKKS
ncbi:hypothetical protein [Legionella waltersii]|uniref:Type I secretion system LssZ n=1 Tax=Legionella waltersii TaxID=66969 RepID=A0A0W1A142_9GAMM|nr:hypothetical protein [Legionella waltersii]KTD75084.1 type I secretion system LssZ [Legionella waltersii]SNV05194.1 type I secretion system LssZ [Legionella waltersii]